jgi:diketogulonate reductase-like aldo/keto reductase
MYERSLRPAPEARSVAAAPATLIAGPRQARLAQMAAALRGASRTAAPLRWNGPEGRAPPPGGAAGVIQRVELPVDRPRAMRQTLVRQGGYTEPQVLNMDAETFIATYRRLTEGREAVILRQYLTRQGGYPAEQVATMSEEEMLAIYDRLTVAEPVVSQIKPQTFGADIAALPDGEQQRRFADALRAGYRSFDAAFDYQSKEGRLTLANLHAAARLLHVPLQELHVVYKLGRNLKGGSSEEVGSELDAQAEAGARAGGGPPGVLMLHEEGRSPAQTKLALAHLATLVRGGRAKGLGLSNIDSVDQLREYYDYCLNTCGQPITHVQNRFTPYADDGAVREFCLSHNIVYMLFGVIGGAQKDLGVCYGEGDRELPAKSLKVLKDDRFVALARAFGHTPESLLLAYLNRKGAATVTHSSGHAASNFASQGLALTAGEVAQIDGLFVRSGPRPASDDEAIEVRALHQAVPSPIASHVLDLLLARPAAHDLFVALARVVNRERKPLSDVIHVLLRLVAHLQYLQDHEPKTYPPWPVSLLDIFKVVTDYVSPAHANLLLGWVERDYLETIGAYAHVRMLTELIPARALQVAPAEPELSASTLSVLAAPPAASLSNEQLSGLWQKVEQSYLKSRPDIEDVNAPEANITREYAARVLVDEEGMSEAEAAPILKTWGTWGVFG